MAKEIERKFLVKDSAYRAIATTKYHIVQGYLNADPDATVRIRISDRQAFITVKSRNRGAERHEWEYPIPVGDAHQMLSLCRVSGVIDKTRYIVEASAGLRWEIDEFHGKLQGLVVAEIELPQADMAFELPDFVGREVTDDPRYYNSSLASGEAPV